MNMMVACTTSCCFTLLLQINLYCLAVLSEISYDGYSSERNGYNLNIKIYNIISLALLNKDNQ